MSEPHAQDEATWQDTSADEPVHPPAPANQQTPHDGGMELAPPPRNAAARALRRFGRLLRRGGRAA